VEGLCEPSGKVQRATGGAEEHAMGDARVRLLVRAAFPIMGALGRPVRPDENQTTAMRDLYLLATSFRRVGPIGLGRVGAVRLGARAFGGDADGGRAP
jgi:hypothetical protein